MKYIFFMVFSHKKNSEMLALATAWMELNGNMLSEISQRKTCTSIICEI